MANPSAEPIYCDSCLSSDNVPRSIGFLRRYSSRKRIKYNKPLILICFILIVFSDGVLCKAYQNYLSLPHHSHHRFRRSVEPVKSTRIANSISETIELAAQRARSRQRLRYATARTLSEPSNPTYGYGKNKFSTQNPQYFANKLPITKNGASNYLRTNNYNSYPQRNYNAGASISSNTVSASFPNSYFSSFGNNKNQGQSWSNPSTNSYQSVKTANNAFSTQPTWNQPKTYEYNLPYGSGTIQTFSNAIPAPMSNYKPPGSVFRYAPRYESPPRKTSTPAKKVNRKLIASHFRDPETTTAATTTSTNYYQNIASPILQYPQSTKAEYTPSSFYSSPHQYVKPFQSQRHSNKNYISIQADEPPTSQLPEKSALIGTNLYNSQAEQYQLPVATNPETATTTAELQGTQTALKETFAKYYQKVLSANQPYKTPEIGFPSERSATNFGTQTIPIPKPTESSNFFQEINKPKPAVPTSGLFNALAGEGFNSNLVKASTQLNFYPDSYNSNIKPNSDVITMNGFQNSFVPVTPPTTKPASYADELNSFLESALTASSSSQLTSYAPYAVSTTPSYNSSTLSPADYQTLLNQMYAQYYDTQKIKTSLSPPTNDAPSTSFLANKSDAPKIPLNAKTINLYTYNNFGGSSLPQAYTPKLTNDNSFNSNQFTNPANNETTSLISYSPQFYSKPEKSKLLDWITKNNMQLSKYPIQSNKLSDTSNAQLAYASSEPINYDVRARAIPKSSVSSYLGSNYNNLPVNASYGGYNMTNRASFTKPVTKYGYGSKPSNYLAMSGLKSKTNFPSSTSSAQPISRLKGKNYGLNGQYPIGITGVYGTMGPNGYLTNFYYPEYGYDHGKLHIWPDPYFQRYIIGYLRKYGFRKGPHYAYGYDLHVPPYYGYGKHHKGLGPDAYADLLGEQTMKEGETEAYLGKFAGSGNLDSLAQNIPPESDPQDGTVQSGATLNEAQQSPITVNDALLDAQSKSGNK